MAWHLLLASRLAYFAAGAVAAGTLVGSPAAREVLRTATRKTIKGSLRLKDGIQDFVERMREDLQDLAAEARAEIDAERGPSPNGHDHDPPRSQA
jgi:hypothetical protein